MIEMRGGLVEVPVDLREHRNVLSWHDLVDCAWGRYYRLPAKPSQGTAMHLRARYRASLALVFCSALVAFTADKRPITAKDLWAFTWIGDPQLSPDASRVAFVRVVVDKKHTGYETSIWSVSTKGGEPQRLTSGIHDSQPRWSPDGMRLAFVRANERDGKPQPGQLYVLSMS